MAEASKVDFEAASLNERYLNFRARIFAFVEKPIFSQVIMFVIVANAITLSLDKFPPHSKPARDAIFGLNLFFYAVFLLEAILLHIAYGFQLYWFKIGTCFDGVILIVSTMELVFRVGAIRSSSTAFRALRVLKLANGWQSFRLLLKSVQRTLSQIGNLLILLLVVIYIFTLLGQSFFATTVTETTSANAVINRNLFKCLPRWHFDEFFWGVLSVFVLISGDAWESVMFDAIKARGYPYSLYFIFVLAVGVFVVLNVFLAILIGNFGDAQEREQDTREKKLFLRRRAPAMWNLDAVGMDPYHQYNPVMRVILRAKDLLIDGRVREPDMPIGGSTVDDGLFLMNGPASGGVALGVVAGTSVATTSTRHQQNNPQEDGSFNIIGSTPVSMREFTTLLILHPLFDALILLCIILSALFITAQNPLEDPNADWYRHLEIGNRIFTVIFTIEITLRIICFGRRRADQRTPFLKNGWNYLDLIVVVVSWLDEILTLIAASGGTAESLSGLRSLRVLRALRPLRLVQRNESLRLVVNTILRVLPQLLHIVVVACIVFVVFALVGISLFKGSFYSCQT
ncbi:unnamed protein product, partial [Amoebophrya sp. A25]|eukprot:GSA25T00013941001.1